MSRIGVRLALFLIRCYKLCISPFLPRACRYVPTCSEYCSEAIERYGLLRGAFLSVKRILRCNPFSKGGYDPVP